MSAPSAEPRDVVIRDDAIRLGQFLKLADLVDNGSDARQLLGQGVVTVNGEVETRRGRQLVPGDVVDLTDLTHPLGTLVRVSR
ncbi:hypothetical protein GCM10011519_13810 [Marmoricola endophyticus]|uniref:RNA-binding S4 domain-containing protein n=1 Tax=Marmoricola endophyticus TaxID=2040280 RepID=A0A917F1K8_9ACTN|nr:RNA-binding S4 domain-containing protein [Marmoricola endophyticus]GGF41284.1 hypothetical protein GCM10011519_13810 [Marmoricola endophyticus]